MMWSINTTYPIDVITYFDEVHLVHYTIIDGVLTELLPSKTGF